ncbi:flagellar basal body rod protein FlgC [Enterococcus saccharolyticus]|uniref:Flagellar basal-body rod protein FlgC n=1 Tax=Candidatus Enterococcus willemsii TaxID=1857215 RepID=A0ABQ6YWE2_9ENTE|nr:MULTISPECIES: flagellar basal body rod protein FlgC [Enterococcus]KAF1302006.1 flagellar basal body rod protein FlgC [Enterococcus sp. CU12B]MCD5002888.1 flagellar basal body rod protein FlgC [Enterococcus saccharolyticus]
MSIFNGLNINASGLSLERFKLDTISTNIANVNTAQTIESDAYRKKTVAFSESLKNVQQSNALTNKQSYGVRIDGIREDDTVNLSYDPTNPAADENGYVEQSNVNVADEMIEMIQTLRTYEANASAVEMNKSMLRKALEISKE